MNSPGEEIILIAHRGAPHLAPENTIPSFKAALDHGARFIETDVRRTRDGILIAFHDDTLRRVTNVEDIFPGRIHDPVGSFAYGELMELHAARELEKKNSSLRGQSLPEMRIPTLEEYLDIFDGGERACPVIELKKPEKYPGIEEDVLSLLMKKKFLCPSGGRDPGPEFPRVILASFNDMALRAIRERNREVSLFFIGNRHTVDRLGGFEGYGETARELGADICMAGTIATPGRIKRARAMGIGVYVYTIDSAILQKFFFMMDVRGIVTNRIDKILI